MPQFTLSELANNAGSSAANAGINLAKEAKGLACGLYKNYTGWATKLDLPTPPPAAFIKAVWDTVCADDPAGLPPSPPPSIVGGQCSCVSYGGLMTWRFNYGGVPYTENTDWGAVGPIQGVGSQVLPSGHTDLYVLGAHCVNGVVTGSKKFVYYTLPPGFSYISAEFRTLNRPDGQADTCGNSPPPPYPYIVPPPAALTKNVTINYNDGTDFTVPLTFAQMNNNLDITVDAGGVGFNFNVDGVGFNFNQNSQNNYINGPSFTLPGPGGGPGGGGAGGDNNFVFNNKLDNITNKIDNTLDVKLDDVIIDVDLIKDTLDSAEDCCPEPPDLDTQTAIVCPIDDGNTYTGIVDLVSVKLDITKLPLSSKIQFGNSSPNVLFAGWLAFTFDGQAYEREPVHFQHNIFTPPKGSNGFFYCLTNGSKGRVTYYVKT